MGKSWIIDEREAEIVRMIFRLFTEPGHRWGIRRITAHLNRHGYRRRSGLLWHPDKVRGIVNNPAVAGHPFCDEAAFSANVPSRAPKYRQVLYPASHEPIITLDAWREAQRIKTENTTVKRTKSTAPIAYPLRNILICGCGKPMKGKASGGAGRPAYYICGDRKHFGPERYDRPVLRKPVVETAVWNFLRGLLGNPAALIDYVREANEQLREQVPSGQQALAEKKTALADVKARLARYHERFERAANAGEEDLAWERIKELRGQETALKTQIAELEAQQTPSSDRDLDAVRARRYLRGLARFFRSRPRYEESLYEALHQHHAFRVAVLAKDLVEATLEFEGEIEPSNEDDSMSRDRTSNCGRMSAESLISVSVQWLPQDPGGRGRRPELRSCLSLESLAPASVRWLLVELVLEQYLSGGGRS